MFVVLGATGHIGSSVAETLLGSGAPVTAVTRDEDKAGSWRARGAQAGRARAHHALAAADD